VRVADASHRLGFEKETLALFGIDVGAALMILRATSVRCHNCRACRRRHAPRPISPSSS